MKKIWVLGICACLMGMTACDGDDNDNNHSAKGAIGADCKAAADCESNYCSELGKCDNAPTDEAKKDDGQACTSADECKSGECNDSKCGPKATDPQVDDKCKDKAEGTECGENKVCNADHECVDKTDTDPQVDDKCKDKAEGTGCGENKVCNAEHQCVDKTDTDPQATKCKDETECPDSHAYECIEGVCVVKELPTQCENKEEGAECGENKVCNAEHQCVDKTEPDPQAAKCKDETECPDSHAYECIEGVCVIKSDGSDPECKDKDEGVECGDNKVCNAEHQCVDKADPSVPVDVCDASVDPCKDRTDGKTICNVVNNKAVCAIRLGCDEGQVMSDDGLCIAPEPPVTQCDKANPCTEEGYQCIDGYCAYVPSDFKYVMIEDLSKSCQEAKTCDSEDPGADIDAVALKKGGSNDSIKYAISVRAYSRSDGKQATTDDKEAATNPSRATGKPDSFIAYPNADGICCYFSKDVSASDTDKRTRTTVSLGGKGGRLILEMEDAIEAGDVLDVLELGNCTLFNTTHKPDAKDSMAVAEEIQVSISSTDSQGDVWKIVGTGKGSTTNKGIIGFNITSQMLQ